MSKTQVNLFNFLSSSNKTSEIDRVRYKECRTPVAKQITPTKTLNRFDNLSGLELQFEDQPAKVEIKNMKATRHSKQKAAKPRLRQTEKWAKLKSLMVDQELDYVKAGIRAKSIRIELDSINALN